MRKRDKLSWKPSKKYLFTLSSAVILASFTALSKPVTADEQTQVTTPLVADTNTNDKAQTANQNTTVVNNPLTTSEPAANQTPNTPQEELPSESTAASTVLTSESQDTDTASSPLSKEEEPAVSEPSEASVTTTSGFYSDDQGNWYYADQNGQKVTGFQTIDGAHLYFDQDGKQAKGKEVKIGDNDYYFDQDNGQMWTNRFRLAYIATRPRSDSRYLSWVYYGQDGAKVRGHQVIDGKEYYFDDSGIQWKGRILKNEDGTINYYDHFNGQKVYNAFRRYTVDYSPFGPTVTDTYYFDDKGNAVSGFQEIEGKLYHFDDDGKLITRSSYLNKLEYLIDYTEIYQGKAYQPDETGILVENTLVKHQFITQDNNTYYLDDEGKVASGLTTIDGKTYYFGDTKEWQYNGPAKVTGLPNAMFHGSVWFEKSGTPHYHIPTNKYDNHVDSYYMYFGEDGASVTNQFVEENSNTYYYGNDGKRVKRSQTIDGKHLYFDEEDGHQIKGSLYSTATGARYYFDNNTGEALTNQDVTVDGITYHLDQTGLAKVTNYPAKTNQLVYFNLYAIAPSGKVYSHKASNTYFKNPSKTAFTTDFYYFDENGKAVANRFVEVSGKWYYFDADGKGVTGAQTINGQNLYFNADGSQVKGATDPDGNYYDINTGQRQP